MKEKGLGRSIDAPELIGLLLKSCHLADVDVVQFALACCPLMRRVLTRLRQEPPSPLGNNLWSSVNAQTSMTNLRSKDCRIEH
jgi:hypothetical protein